MGQRITRACTECGKTFKGSARRCGTCRATERMCGTCGEVFVGRGSKCPACYRTSHPCSGCGRIFRGTAQRCDACSRPSRACTECGQPFKRRQRRCRACQATERACGTCGCVFTGAHLRCAACRTLERSCEGCGRTFKSHQRFCEACRSSERLCAGCGLLFTGARRFCFACSLTERVCTGCSRKFRGSGRTCNTCYVRNLLPAERLALRRRKTNMRRARKLGAQIIGPISREAYAAISASGPCVYCGAPATTVDHVRPLARGGLEIEGNLVPACHRCNSGKRDRLLTEWRPERVAYAVASSPIVAAEWAALAAGGTCQAFGYDWLERLEPDTRPEMLSGDGRVIFDRPKAAGDEGSEEAGGDG